MTVRPRGAFERILPSEQMSVLLSFYTSISTKYNASGKHEPAGEILFLPKYKIKAAIESVILSAAEPEGRHIVSGSCPDNTINI